jgi:predicted transcriptional regulator
MSQLFSADTNVNATTVVATATTVGVTRGQANRFKNRSRMEIVAGILNIARTGALKTHLMYKANLSYMVVTQYLEFLTSADLIKEIFDEQGMAKLYQTTPRGLKYLEVYSSLQNLAGLEQQKELPQKSALFG